MALAGSAEGWVGVRGQSALRQLPIPHTFAGTSVETDVTCAMA